MIEERIDDMGRQAVTAMARTGGEITLRAGAATASRFASLPGHAAGAAFDVLHRTRDAGRMSERRLQHIAKGDVHVLELDPPQVRAVTRSLGQAGVRYAVERDGAQAWIHFEGRDLAHVTHAVRRALKDVGVELRVDGQTLDARATPQERIQAPQPAIPPPPAPKPATPEADAGRSRDTASPSAPTPEAAPDVPQADGPMPDTPPDLPDDGWEAHVAVTRPEPFDAMSPMQEHVPEAAVPPDPIGDVPPPALPEPPDDMPPPDMLEPFPPDAVDPMAFGEYGPPMPDDVPEDAPPRAQTRRTGDGGSPDTRPARKVTREDTLRELDERVDRKLSAKTRKTPPKRHERSRGR